MLQRIQSVFLAAALICSGLVFFSPFFTLENSGLSYIFNTNGITLVQVEGNKVLAQYILLPILAGIACALTLFIIFRFKNRMLQVKLCQLSLLLNTLLLASVFYYSEEAVKLIRTTMQIKEDLKPDYALATILPIIAIIFTLMAIRSIKKDEALVRAADRIR